MTEAEWLTAAKPEEFLDHFWDVPCDRQLRLFAVACCHRIWPLMTDERCRAAVDLAELSVDEPVDQEKLDLASGSAEEAYEEYLGEWTEGEFPVEKSLPCEAASYASNSPMVRVEDAVTVATATSACVRHQVDEETAQALLLRCIFGNPFCPVAFAPSWRSETVVALAAGIYEQRAFDRLPILADALEEAGCDHPNVLSHSRGRGPHARGCWVVDGVLGKS